MNTYTAKAHARKQDGLHSVVDSTIIKTMNRNQISFPEHLHVSPLRFTRNVGVREAIILAVGLLSSFLLLLSLYHRYGLLNAVIVAAVFAVVTIAVAFLPIRGYHIEQYIAIVIKFYIQKRKYIHKTAYSVPEQIVAEAPTEAQEGAPSTPPTPPSEQPSTPQTPLTPAPAPMILPEQVAPVPVGIIILVTFAYFLILTLGTMLLLRSQSNVIRIPIEGFN